MTTALNKRQQARNERILQDLIATVPGNDRCADCGSKNPAWASWNLGIFLCINCASFHRKLGTHISKVKSVTMDSWSNDQIDNMRNMGNVKANAIYNPNPSRHPAPAGADSMDAQMERYIRGKYEYQTFRRDERTGKVLPAPPSNINTTSDGHQLPLGLGLNKAPKFTSQLSNRYTEHNRTTKPSPIRSASFSQGQSSERFTQPSSKVQRVLGVDVSYSSVSGAPQSGVSFLSTPGSSASNSAEMESKLKQLKDMGFGNEKRNIEVLRGAGGDLVATVEILIRTGGNSVPPTPASTANSSNPFDLPASSNNPFDAPAQQQQQQQQQQQPQQQQQQYNPFGGPGQQMQQPQQLGLAAPQNQLFPNRTGGDPFTTPQSQAQSYNPYQQQAQALVAQQQVQQQQLQAQQAQQQQALLQQQQAQQMQQQAHQQAQQMQQQAQQAAQHQAQQQAQQMQQQSAQFQSSYNPYLTGAPQNPTHNPFQQQQQHPAPGQLHPLLQQVSLAGGPSQPPNAFPQSQPQFQQPQSQFQQQPQQQQFFNPQQQQQYAQLTPQQTSSSSSSRIDKSSILALYNSSHLGPTPPPSQHSSQGSLSSLGMAAGGASAGGATHSNNPFLAGAPGVGGMQQQQQQQQGMMMGQMQGMNGMNGMQGMNGMNGMQAMQGINGMNGMQAMNGMGHQKSQESVDFGGWAQGGNGRHSPDAFAHLSFRQR